MKKKIFSVYGAITLLVLAIIAVVIYYSLSIGVTFSEIKTPAFNKY